MIFGLDNPERIATPACAFRAGVSEGDPLQKQGGRKMKASLNFTLLIVVVCVSTVFLSAMESCENDINEGDVEEQPVTFSEADPPIGSEIDVDTTIILRFSAPPRGVTVTGNGTFSMTVFSVEAKITGPFIPGPLNFVVTWRDGQQILTYTVKMPDVGEEITVTSDESQTPMVLIPAGDFLMGTNEAPDPQVPLIEAPIHTVFVDAFFMDVYEVTNADYQKFVWAHPEWQKDNQEDIFYLEHWNGNDFPIWKADHPVTHVNWYAAMAYAQWVGKRLPTEAEWEYAARGGLVGKKFPWGDESINETRANYDFRVGDTSPVGQYPPNGYGLYDMAGNVCEWCLDEAIPDFYADSPLKPLAGVPENSISNLEVITANFITVETPRILRGGSAFSSAEIAGVASRGGKPPQSSLSSTGFRCVTD